MSTPFSDLAPAARPSPEPSAAGGGPPRVAAAFTLIELLVSMTVTLLLVVALMQIFNAAANTWQHGEAQVDAYREARGALQFMARDLSATLQASYTQTVSVAPTTFSPALPTLVLQHSTDYVPDAGPLNEEVYCLTNIPNSGAVSGMSSLCAVGYYCKWMPGFQAVSSDGVDRRPRAYALMRQSLDSNGTFQLIKNAPPNNPLTFDNLFSATKTTPAPSVTQLAAYVWDLRFRIDTDLNDQKAPYQDGNNPSPPDHSPDKRTYQATTSPYPAHLPPYVEIRFKALSDIAGRRLEGLNTGVMQSTWKDTDATFTAKPPYSTIIQPNAQQFVLRVPLINANPPPTPTPGT